jgi:uncharacterized membrane protein
MEPIFNIAKICGPLGAHRNPMTALVVGFLAGGIGLSLYFRSFRDGVATVVIGLIALSELGATGGWLLGAAIAGLWGLLRAEASNRLLAAVAAPSPARGTTVA